MKTKLAILILLAGAACAPPTVMDDPTARRFEDRSAAIESGLQAIEKEAPRVARGDRAGGESWAVIIDGYRSCEGMRRDYRADINAAYSRGAKEAVAAFKSDNSFTLWLGGWGVKLIIGLICLGVLMILIRWRRAIFGLLAGVR